jgi:hypothetical protein
MNPSGTFHAISPVLTLTATSSPNGGAEQGILSAGFQNRPTGPPHGVVPQPRRLSAAIGPLLHLPHLPDVEHVGEDVAERRIVGEAVPVAAADRGRERHHEARRRRPA